MNGEINWIELNVYFYNYLFICRATTTDSNNLKSLFDSAFVDSLKCYRCSSASSAFCNDPFDISKLNQLEKYWAYPDCAYPQPHKPGQIVVCQKAIRLSRFWFRFCVNSTWRSSSFWIILESCFNFSEWFVYCFYSNSFNLSFHF